ncbi:MAG: hypothetical protein NVSMB54_10410 [Ktedonobacteraceae bacterium]
MLLQANTPRVVSWVRTLAVMGSLVVLVWFFEGVEALNFVEAGFPSASFSLGLGAGMLGIGTALSALGLGRIGIGAAVGTGIGYLFFYSPFGRVAFFIAPITCLLGTLIGWGIQRASLKKTLTASS